MENFSYHVPFYVVTGGVAASGHSSEIAAGQVALIDRQTWSVATSAGNGKEFFFAQGNHGGKDWYGETLTATHKSPFFLAKDIKNIYKSYPQKITNEEWVIGYDGSQSSKGLSFEKGKSTKIKFYFYGDPIYRKFGGPKEYVISYSPEQDCTDDDCDLTCGPDGLDCRPHTSKIIDKINNHVELRNFGVQAKLVSSTYSAAATNMTKYCLSVCDNGDALSLNAVRAQVPSGVSVSRSGRSGSISTYTFCISDTASAPSAFAQTADVALAVCEACPAGSTLTAGKTVFTVDRAIAPSTDLSTGGARQTYADTIGTAYETAAAKVITTANVNTSTDVFTSTAHGLVTGEKVTYSNGGGTTAAGLVTATDYYAIVLTANTFKVATTLVNAIAGTAINITGTGNNLQSFTPVILATFIGLNGSVATVNLSVAEGASITALLSDTVTQAYTAGATCVFATPSTIAWTTCGAGISSVRTLKTKLARPDCNASGDRLAELTALLSQFADVDISTLAKVAGDACIDEYTVNQFSNDCVDEGCLTSNVTFTYNSIPSLDDAIWTVVETAPEEDLTAKCGIVVTAGYTDPSFSNCSFNPFDYYNNEPIRMEVSVLEEGAGNCDYANLPTVFRRREGKIARQSGEYVVREVIMKTEAYIQHINQFSLDSRTREAFDLNLLDSVDRKAYYILYYVTFNANYNGLERKNEQEKFTAVFAIKESDSAQTAFENGPIAILQAKSGVALHINS